MQLFLFTVGSAGMLLCQKKLQQNKYDNPAGWYFVNILAVIIDFLGSFWQLKNHKGINKFHDW